MNILIIEDDEQTAKQLYKLLKSEKYTPDIASGYHDAKKHLDQSTYSLILLDWNLGDGDGLTLLKEQRAMDIDLSLIHI